MVQIRLLEMDGLFGALCPSSGQSEGIISVVQEVEAPLDVPVLVLIPSILYNFKRDYN